MSLNQVGRRLVWRMLTESQLTSIDGGMAVSAAVSDDAFFGSSHSPDDCFEPGSLYGSPSYSREESLLSTDSAIDCDSDPDLAVSPLPRVRGRSSLDLSDDHMTHALFSFFKNYLSASGSSTVAIDNKIEQAMDLVKSHLMFAVREEVEVLKERITELLDRIAFLETENSLLRAAATQETLAQISHLESTFRTSSSGNSSGSNPAPASASSSANGGAL